MFISKTRNDLPVRYPQSTRATVDELKAEVHELTEQTDRYRDQNLTSLAVTTVAGAATLAGGALTLLQATENLGLGVAAVGGAALIAGIGLCLHTNGKYQRSEAERLAVAGELFEARRDLGREKIRRLFQ